MLSPAERCRLTPPKFFKSLLIDAEVMPDLVDHRLAHQLHHVVAVWRVWQIVAMKIVIRSGMVDE